MIEGDLETTGGGSFPVLSPTKVTVNSGQYGRLATLGYTDGTDLTYVGNPLGTGHIEYNYTTIRLRDDAGNILWTINPQTTYNCRVASPVYFRTIASVDYAFFITTDYPSNGNIRIARIKLSDGTLTRGAQFALSIGAVHLFFTTADGVFFNNSSNYNVYKADLDTLTVSLDSDPAKYLSQSTSIHSYLTYDLKHAFRSIEVKGNFDNSQSWSSNLQFMGLTNHSGKAHRCYLNLPDFVKDLPITDGRYVTQISDDIVMNHQYYDSNIRMTKAIMHTSPSYFDKVDFDRWIDEIIEVLL